MSISHSCASQSCLPDPAQSVPRKLNSLFWSHLCFFLWLLLILLLWFGFSAHFPVTYTFLCGTPCLSLSFFQSTSSSLVLSVFKYLCIYHPPLLLVFFSFLVLCFISSPLLRFVFSKTFYVSSVSFVLTHKNTDPFLLKGCEWNVDMPIGSENGYLPQWDSLFHFPSTDGFLAFGTDPCTDRGQSTCCCDFQRFVHCTNVSVSSVAQRCLLFWPLWTLQGSMDIIWRCETQFFEFKHSGVSEEEFLQENSFLYIFFLES